MAVDIAGGRAKALSGFEGCRDNLGDVGHRRFDLLRSEGRAQGR
jgi:hypothetical protein